MIDFPSYYLDKYSTMCYNTFEVSRINVSEATEEDYQRIEENRIKELRYKNRSRLERVE